MSKSIGFGLMILGGLMVCLAILGLIKNQINAETVIFLIWGIGSMWWGWALKSEKNTLMPQIVVVIAAIAQIIYYIVYQNQ